MRYLILFLAVCLAVAAGFMVPDNSFIAFILFCAAIIAFEVGFDLGDK